MCIVERQVEKKRKIKELKQGWQINLNRNLKERQSTNWILKRPAIITRKIFLN